MSKASQATLWVVLAVLVIGGIWWWSMSNNGSYSPSSTYNPGATSTSQSNGAPSDNSDQAINQDMTNANAQINGFSSDSASIDQGLNDQPVQQSQF
jgi:hypothetical protein